MHGTTKRFNGMNGTIMLNTPDRPGVTVGYVPGESYGYKRNLRVTVELRLERLERQFEYETTEHRTTKAPLDFAITTSVWRPDGRDIVGGGATVEPLREVLASGMFGEGFDAERVSQLIDLERWHLNSLKAGCAHQTVVMEESTYGPRPSLELTQPCPITGYKYGRSWLLEPLPEEDFVSNLLEILRDVDQTRIYVNPELTH